jgi:predicted nucleic acid-binding protein
LVISDSTPLIYLAALSDFGLLKEVVGSICIPRAVYEEVVVHGVGFPVREEVLRAEGAWIHVVRVRDSRRVEAVARENSLDRGEAEVVVLYQEIDANLLLLDEQRAVRYARKAGLRIIRTPMVYAAAKQRGLIASFRGKLEELRKVGFWLKDRDFKVILRELGEE